MIISQTISIFCCLRTNSKSVVVWQCWSRDVVQWDLPTLWMKYYLFEYVYISALLEATPINKQVEFWVMSSESQKNAQLKKGWWGSFASFWPRNCVGDHGCRVITVWWWHQECCENNGQHIYLIYWLWSVGIALCFQRGKSPTKPTQKRYKYRTTAPTLDWLSV